MRKHLRGNRGTRWLAILLTAAMVVGSVDTTVLAEAAKGTEEQTLPVAEAGDPRGLLEHLPAVGGLHRQDLIDAPLSDNGVALPAQAGVHKQLVDVPKTD